MRPQDWSRVERNLLTSRRTEGFWYSLCDAEAWLGNAWQTRFKLHKS